MKRGAFCQHPTGLQRYILVEVVQAKRNRAAGAAEVEDVHFPQRALTPDAILAAQEVFDLAAVGFDQKVGHEAGQSLR